MKVATKAPALVNLPLKNCNASIEESGHPCENALTFDGKSWAYRGKVPSWISVELEDPSSKVTKVEILTDGRTDHKPTLIKIEVFNASHWIQPAWIKVETPVAASFKQASGRVSIPPGTSRTDVTFTPMENISHVRLTIISTDARNDNATIDQLAVNGFAYSSTLSPVGCSASFEQNEFSCEDAIKGEGNGWAYIGKVPAWISVEVSEAVVGKVEIISSDRWLDHNPTSFKLELLQAEEWIQPEYIKVQSPPNGTFDQSTGFISVPPGTFTVVLEFSPMESVTEVRLHVFETDAGHNNAVIQHVKIFAVGLTLPPTPIG